MLINKTLTMLTTATVAIHCNITPLNIYEMKPKQVIADINVVKYPRLEADKLIEISDSTINQRQEKERIKNVCFNSYNLNQVSGITKEELREVLSSKEEYRNLLEYSDTFVEAEQKYGVNVFALIAIPALESGWNTSPRANNGNNNIVGMAVEEDSDKGTVYVDKHECIMDLARQLRTYYLTPGANFYNGTSTSKVNKKYCATETWYKDIDSIGDELCLTYHQIYGYGEE